MDYFYNGQLVCFVNVNDFRFVTSIFLNKKTQLYFSMLHKVQPDERSVATILMQRENADLQKVFIKITA
jgi:hypothetical protein